MTSATGRIDLPHPLSFSEVLNRPCISSSQHVRPHQPYELITLFLAFRAALGGEGEVEVALL